MLGTNVLMILTAMLDVEYPDYQVPSSILEWPGNFNNDLDLNQS